MPVKTVIQHRRDTEANWTGVTLAEGEFGYVTSGDNAGNFKIGDGSTVWADLPFLANQVQEVEAGDGLTKTDNVLNADFGTTSGTVLEGSHATTASGIHGVTGSVVGTTDSQTVTNKTLQTYKDKVNVVASAATGTINVDVNTANVWYYTSSATANFTLNFRASSSATLSSKLAVGEAITVVFLNTNGSTPYFPSAFQIDGTALSGGTAVKWQLGEAPGAGDANAINSYTFTIIKTASTPTYSVIASQSRFSA